MSKQSKYNPKTIQKQSKTNPKQIQNIQKLWETPPATIQIGLQQQQWAFRQDGRPPAQPPQRREADAAVAGDQLAAHHRLAAATDG